MTLPEISPFDLRNGNLRRALRDSGYSAAAATFPHTVAPSLHPRRASSRGEAADPQHLTDAQLDAILGPSCEGGGGAPAS